MEIWWIRSIGESFSFVIREVYMDGMLAIGGHILVYMAE